MNDLNSRRFEDQVAGPKELRDGDLIETGAL